MNLVHFECTDPTHHALTALDDDIPNQREPCQWSISAAAACTGHGGDTEKSSPISSLTHIPFSTMLRFMNIKQMFGFPTTKAALNASFKTGKDASAEGSRHCNVFWGTNGVIS
jgi:hypothetical protein